jgi:hypothetical protein
MSASNDQRKVQDHPYRAYLLRCWQEGKAPHGDEIRWRYSLEEILHKRSRQVFDDLESLVAFLKDELIDRGEGQ